tara:strand:- start:2462 stop:2905 length:444 start_codon:yes stop_codon:yes gene_type:complete
VKDLQFLLKNVLIKIINLIKKLFRYIYYTIISVKEYLISLKISNTKSIKDKFTIIYNSKYWSDPFSEKSVSGYGSVPLVTENIIKELSIFIDTDNIYDGEFRIINLLKSPFNFPIPYKSLDDSFDDNEDMFLNKRLSIWKISVLKDI